MSALIAIGGAILEVIGLNPQSIESEGEGRAVVTPTFGGNDIQLTGVDPEKTTIRALTVPLIMGGGGEIALLKAFKDTQVTVPLIRLSSNFLGSVTTGGVIVTAWRKKEGRIHPLTGVGRTIELEVELLHGSGALGWLSELL